MENKPLMPLATAVWLVDNTSLSFSQISKFCQLHELEVQSIADGEEAYNMKGLNPIASGQLTKDEIQRCEIIIKECIYYADINTLNVFITTEILKCHIPCIYRIHDIHEIINLETRLSQFTLYISM